MPLPAAGIDEAALPRFSSRLRLYRVSRLVGVLAVALLLLAPLLTPAPVTAVAVPIALAGALVGLPHGAVDHVIPAWLAGRPLPPRSVVAVLTGYVAVVATGAALLRLAPTPTLVIFLAVAAWHFGR